jgi:hypothetical protein
MADILAMYVTTLFKELDELGVTQREVAQHFGVSEQMASRWARGVVPMSHQRGDAFLAFVKQKEQEALERAKAQPRQAGRSTVITGPIPTPEEVLQRKFAEFWFQWHDELMEANGEVYENLANQLQMLRPYMAMDKEKLREALNTSPTARRARTTITTAAKAVIREVKRLERMKPLGEAHE